MAVREFGVRKRRFEGRLLVIGALLTTGAIVGIPKAEAAGPVLDWVGGEAVLASSIGGKGAI